MFFSIYLVRIRAKIEKNVFGRTLVRKRAKKEKQAFVRVLVRIRAKIAQNTIFGRLWLK